jgi:diguanylate cyclase (GGDEF)-like protein
MGDAIEAAQDSTSGVGLGPTAAPEVTGAASIPVFPRWMTSVAIYAISAALAGGALALLAYSPLHDALPLGRPISQPAMAAVVCVLFGAALWAPVSLHHRGNTIAFALDSIPIMLGLVFLRPSLLVLSAVCAEAFVYTIVRKLALIKIALNVALIGFSTAVSALVYRELLGAYSPVSLRGWASAAVALCAAAVTPIFVVRIVSAIYGQTTERRTGSQLTFEAMLIAASICLALVVLDAAWFDLWTALPLLLVGALIIVAYRGFTRLTLRFASLQRLYDFSQVLGTANLEPTSMSIDVLRQVCTVMRARRAQLILAESSGIPRRISLDEGRPSGVELINLDAASFVTDAITTGEASLYTSTNAQQRGTSYDHIVGEYRAALVAPLMGGENTAIGAIVALDRDEDFDEFDEDDLRLFGALVANASVNLERARLVEELRYEVDSKTHQATHDMLTGLPNRMLFTSRAATALNESAGVAIVLLDLDRFKDVNDTLGHAIGDRLLLEISERLQRATSERATVARLGGDEFALVIPDVSDLEQAVALVNELHTVLSRPIEMDGLTLAVTASAGIALAPRHGDDVALLLQRADIAMYLAKERRTSVEVYSVEHDQSMRRWLMLGGLLTHALETKSELSVVYHAIGDVRSHQIVQVEALCRWNHPEQGSIPPDEFIAIAEQMGLINQISEFVLSEACAHLADWRRAGLHVSTAVNISGRELSDSSLVDRVARHLEANALPAELLTLEVTETEVMADLLQASRVLDELAALGIRIAIDDYGTGYSSLAYLHRLPVQELKIDRSFVTNLPNEPSNRIIVRSSIAMAHSLGLSVVAEGAEDEVTCAMLADAGCDLIQGYYLAKPMGADDLKAWLLQGASLEFTPLRGDATEGSLLALSSHGNGEGPAR